MPHKNSYQGYWSVYGGLHALFKSAYFWAAIATTSMCSSIWMSVDGKADQWRNCVTSGVPSLLGFSLGGMAIMLSFSSGRFLDAIRQNGKKDSYLMKMVASFFHLSIVLSFSLIAQIFLMLEMPYCLKVATQCVAFFSFVYGILLVPSTVASIWHTARIFNAAIENEET
ncbi:hypothetical protein [Novosphingobium decolorationis]|uniref:Uncharacterized protein n=1 Tax=Novosphingobium decolorationis TaxID=2698673 RepID=A0ABX8E2Z9_9SPHN|nr:hypothetical protein [Novosphingobium decolorationis]QVM83324.1 hypothetical protein HT578_06095 [Novosphingobium decolorationis]